MRYNLAKIRMEKNPSHFSNTPTHRCTKGPPKASRSRSSHPSIAHPFDSANTLLTPENFCATLAHIGDRPRSLASTNGHSYLT